MSIRARAIISVITAAAVGLSPLAARADGAAWAAAGQPVAAIGQEAAATGQEGPAVGAGQEALSEGEAREEGEGAPSATSGGIRARAASGAADDGYANIPAPPYHFDLDESENISPVTGALQYRETDYVLPGKAGLDLVIGIKYDSHFAQHEHAYWRQGLSGWGVAFTPAKQPHAEAAPLSLAHGWSLQFTQITNNGYGNQVVLPDGRVYSFNPSYDRWDYDNLLVAMNDVFEMASTTTEATQYSYGGRTSRWALYYHDGRTEYLNHGGPIAIVDRHGNSIKFKYEANKVTITDSYGRETVISKQGGTDASTTSVSLPGGKTITYAAADGALKEKTDAEGLSTVYESQTAVLWYSTLMRHDSGDVVSPFGNKQGPEYPPKYEWSSYNYFWAYAKTDHHVTQLTAVSRPTGLRTEWEYHVAQAYNGSGLYSKKYVDLGSGYESVSKIKARRDLSEGAAINEKIYDDSAWDYENYKADDKYVKYYTDKSSRGRIRITETATGNTTYLVFDNDWLKRVERRKDASGRTYYEEHVPHYNGYNKPTQTDRVIDGKGSSEMTVYESGRLTKYNPVAGDSLYQQDMKYNKYGLLTEKKYYKSPGVQVVETYTPSADGKTIERAEVRENGALIRKTEYGHNPDGTPAWQRDYKDASSHVQTSWAYSYGADGGASGYGVAVSKGGATERFQYDASGDLARHVDGGGHATSYLRDPAGRVVKETHEADGSCREWEHDVAGNAVLLRDENGRESRWKFTPYGKLERVVRDVRGLSAVTEKYEYYPDMSLKSGTDGEGNVTSYAYDALGRVLTKEVRDRNGAKAYVERYERSGSGSGPAAQSKTVRLTGDEAAPDPKSPNMKVVEIYDWQGALAKSGRCGADEEPAAYDSYERDLLGNAVRFTSAEDASKGRAYTKKYGFNAAGDALWEENADGGRASWRYDLSGRLTGATDAMGAVSEIRYDGRGLPVYEASPFEAGRASVRETAYDVCGNATEVRASINKPNEPARTSKTVYAYDSRHRLSRAVLHDGGAAAMTYFYLHDAAGNLTRVTDGRGNAVSYAYDGMNRLASATDALGATEAWLYDGNGNPREHTARDGSKTVKAYDWAGNVLTAAARLPNGAAAPERVQNTYAATGFLTRSQNEAATMDYVYDAKGRLVSETGTGGASKSHSYDLDGRRTAFTLSQGGAAKLSLGYSYDAAGRLGEVRSGGTAVARYTSYDRNGNLLAATYPTAGVSATYSYNQAGLLTSLTNKKGAAVLAGSSYTYYLDGSPASKTEDGERTDYAYYDYGALKSESSPTLTRAYQYDAAGNRTSMAVTGSGAAPAAKSAPLAAPLGAAPAAPRAAAPAKAPEKPYSLSIGFDGDAVTAVFRNNAAAPVNVNVIIAAYNAKGAMRSALVSPGSVPTGGSMGASMPKTPEAAVYKAYAWDANFSPLTEAAEIPADADGGAGQGGGQPVSYTVSYDANGGWGAPAPQTKNHGAVLTLSLAAPTRAGHEFLGWSESAAAGSPSYQGGGLYSADASATLYAVWFKTEFAVTYDANGGAGAPAPQTKRRGEPLVLSETVPARGGWVFLGWSADPSAAEAEWQAGGVYRREADAALHAVWTRESAIITYDANGGEGAPPPQEKDGAETVLSDAEPTREGHVFIGWADSPDCRWDGGGTIYRAGGVYGGDAPTTLHAVWAPASYTVTYDANGGAGAPETQTKAHGVKLVLSDEAPYWAGREFLGWAVAEDAAEGDVAYGQGQPYYDDADLNLRAVWALSVYTVSYDANGGTGAPAPQAKTHGVVLTLSQATPTRAGHEFLGWSESAAADAPAYQAGGLYSADAPATLRAVWKPLSGDIAYVYEHDAANRLVSETKTQYGASEAFRYYYNANGAQTRKTRLDGATETTLETRAYDVFGRLASETSGGVTATYTYQPDSLRLSKTVGGVKTTHVWDGGQMVAELNAANAVTARYIRGAGGRIVSSLDAAGAAQYYLHNVHGDVAGLTDASGALTKTYKYDAFGGEANPAPTDPNPFRYAGEYFDRETGDYYLRARYYDPGMGRFLSEDAY
ncbi:MAG: InlB B-repeat-containing protein, partial [Clostridiales Family XIII bacterium]|nr:InlB B-repeat-containing protein [Clostridiales Family XIII bacterium]